MLCKKSEVFDRQERCSTMNSILIAFCAVVSCLVVVSAINDKTCPDNSCSVPIVDSSRCFTTNSRNAQIRYVADRDNKCWFWQCRRKRVGRRVRRVLTSMRCATQSFVSSFYDTGVFNPCSEKYLGSEDKFDCTRKQLNPDATPPCFEEFQENDTCKNGGVIMVQGSICWCDCTGTGSTSHDCSLAQDEADRIAAGLSPHDGTDDPCPGGVPLSNWCAIAGARLNSGDPTNPCQNGGRCRNQCTDHVCECIPPFTAGRNCEEFRCTDDIECMNGGTCDRNGNAEVASCTCPPDWTGVMCEIRV